MSRQPPIAEVLPLLAAAYPRTLFTDPMQVRPLKIGIDQDLLAAPPEGIKPVHIRRLLYWYVKQPPYLKALLHGHGRIDLTGTMVDTDIPAEIREQARERWLQLRAGKRPTAKPGLSRSAAPAPTINLQELYAMAIDAKLEITLKFSTLPNARPAGQGKIAFALKTPDGQFVTAVINNKSWNKLTTANTDWPQWVAALSGTMGARTERGFTLANPGLQVFEKKPKTAETAKPEPAPTPVTVTTKTGTTVTVTKRTPLSLENKTPGASHDKS